MNWQIREAKKKDDGTYARLGMLYECASYFNVDVSSECVSYIVDTYLECIDGCSFLEWIRGTNSSEKVVVLDQEFLNEHFDDLISYSTNLEELQDLFMYLYNQEVWIDEQENVLYSTVFDLSLKNRNRFRFIDISMKYERLCTLREYEIINWADIDEFVESMANYGYDISEDYEYRTDDVDETVDNIMERMQEIFPL